MSRDAGELEGGAAAMRARLGFAPAPAQLAAIRAFVAWGTSPGPQVGVLTGYAGAGKTSILPEIAYQIREGRARKRDVPPTVFWLATTGKASSRLNSALKLPSGSVRTVHAAAFGEADEDESGNPDFSKVEAKDFTLGNQALVIVDEGSMFWKDVYDRMLKVLPPSRVRILISADPFQLPPVGDQLGPDLDRPIAHLSEVQRHAGGILRLATAIRKGERPLPSDEDLSPQVSRYRDTDLVQAAKWLVRRRERDIDSTLLTWTHEVRRDVNRLVRSFMGHDHETLAVGDRVLIKANNRRVKVFNGEVFEVSALTQPDDFGNCEVKLNGVRAITVTNTAGTMQLPTMVHLPSLGDPQAFKEYMFRGGMEAFRIRAFDEARGFYTQHMQNVEGTSYKVGPHEFARWIRSCWIQADYGECLTVHAAQGSEWGHVGFIADPKVQWFVRKKGDEAARLVYTAYTRAAEKLAIFYV